jgi:hypothetical protein
VTEWPPPEIFPERRKPHRLPRPEYQKLLQPVFFAACTKNRIRILLSQGVPAMLGADGPGSWFRMNGSGIPRAAV